MGVKETFVLNQPGSIDGSGRSVALVSDLSTQMLMSEILKELKIMNFHLSILTDNHIEEG